MPARGEEEEDNDDDDDDDDSKEEDGDEELEEIEPDQHEGSKQRKHYISGTMEKSSSKSNNSGYKTALDRMATTTVGVAEAEEEEEEEESTSGFGAGSGKANDETAKEPIDSVGAPTAEQQRKSLEMSAKEVVDKSSAKRKEKTTAKTIRRRNLRHYHHHQRQKGSGKRTRRRRRCCTHPSSGATARVLLKGRRKGSQICVRVALSGFNTEELKKAAYLFEETQYSVFFLRPRLG